MKYLKEALTIARAIRPAIILGKAPEDSVVNQIRTTLAGDSELLTGLVLGTLFVAEKDERGEQRPMIAEAKRLLRFIGDLDWHFYTAEFQTEMLAARQTFIDNLGMTATEILAVDLKTLTPEQKQERAIQAFLTVGVKVTQSPKNVIPRGELEYDWLGLEDLPPSDKPRGLKKKES